ncbi:Hypothetical protein SRAE_2000070400 [Strongyloides ratti]|uniref:Uncharacterized protein n=1 Tax=Strongyloides ratti TaxID=34506 RepID=A0A090L8F3_STRRB|nr:Hypothetical protein SRAE_2000070400 [Strongyloides ratti]CEF66032.1 Hypothetical protein SRAE_2000070400 [Strongyloides ratti]
MPHQMKGKQKISPKTPYKYTQYLTNYCSKFSKDNYNFNKIIMNDVDYVNTLCDNFSNMLKKKVSNINNKN